MAQNEETTEAVEAEETLTSYTSESGQLQKPLRRRRNARH